MPLPHSKSTINTRSSTGAPVSERQQMALAMQLSTEKQTGETEGSSKSSTEQRNERGETPLHLASIKGDLAQVNLLLDQGADPNTPDFAGWRPLHEACNHGWLEVASTLVAWGAGVNVRGLNEDTPLHDAAVNNHHQLVLLLLEKGADPTLKNKRGKTAADVGATPEIVRLISTWNQESGGGSREDASARQEAAPEPAGPPEEQSPAPMRRLPASAASTTGPSAKDKSGSSPRVTLRIHQIKEKKEKSKAAAAGGPQAAAAPVPSPEDPQPPHNGNGGETKAEEGVNGTTNGTSLGGQGGTGGGGNGGSSITGNGGSSAGGPVEVDTGEVAGKEEESVETSVAGQEKRACEPEEEESRKKRRRDDTPDSTDSPGPKVPPLKIVLPAAGEEQARKRHNNLPYVVAAGGPAPEEPQPPTPPAPEQDHHVSSPAATTDDSHKRVLRSHRSGNGGSSGQSGNSSPAGGEVGSPRQGSPAVEGGIAASEQPSSAGTEEAKEASSGESGPAGACELHPRKRKLKPREAVEPAAGPAPALPEAPPAPLPPHEQPVTNCLQLFLNIRKQIDRRRKGLFAVQPKPPQGFKDYLMNRCTYVLAGNANNRIPPPTTSPPASVLPDMKDMFLAQEKERYRLRTQHVIEKEKLVLSVEQEILRVHGRAARALANQALPFSACTILRDEEVYSPFTAEQEEKERNARSRYNGRLFISWLQDVDDKWEKIKEAMLLRHHNEAESLHAVQKMDWEWKLKETTAGSADSKPCAIDETHVPMVHVSDDFDLLPA